MRGTIHQLFADEGESDDDAFNSLFDSESWDESDDDNWDESLRPRFNPRASTPFIRRAPPSFRPSPALAGARVAGGSSGGQVRFDRPVATAQAIEQLKAETRKAIAEVRQETQTNLGRLDTRLKSTATQVEALGKRVAAGNTRVGAIEQRAQLLALLPMLQKPPKLKSIKLEGETQAKGVTAEYEDDKNDFLPLLIAMGGLGGGSSGTTGGGMDSNMAMMMAIVMMGSNK